MSLLAPLMLAGAAALAVPVILHLIARHRFPVQDFPTVRLLRYERRTNVFAWRLIDRGQLLLRLLVLALPVLAMARLFSPALSSEPAPRNLAVVLDASASMRMETKDAERGGTTTLLELGRRRAQELVREVRAPARCALLSAGDTTQLIRPLEQDPAAVLAGLDSIQASDGTGPGLVRAVARACEMLRGRREVRSQVVVLTDLRASAFEARDQWDLGAIEQARRDLGDRLEIVFLDVAGEASENVALLDAHLRGQEVRPGDDVHVIAHVANGGRTAKAPALRLSIGGQVDPQVRSVPLDAGAEAYVDMTARTNRAQRTFGEVALQEHDALPLDDRFLVPVNIADVRRVLVVRASEEKAGPESGGLERLGQDAGRAGEKATGIEEPIDGATILRYVLNPGRELGSGYTSGIDVTMVTAEALAAQPLSKYDLVVLYDTSALPEKVLQDLDTFVRQGKSILMVCSAACNPLRFNKTMASGVNQRPALAPAQIGNDRPLNPPAGIDPDATRHAVLAPFRDRLQGDLSVVRFATVREIRSPQDAARVVFRATDGTPLAIERNLEQGHVMLLAFGLELDRGNIARSRAFPAIMGRLVDYLTGRLEARPPDVFPAGQMRVLDVSEPPFAFETTLDLARLVPADGAAREHENPVAPPPSAEHPARANGIDGGTAPPRAAVPHGLSDSQTGSERVRVESLAISPEKQVVLKGLPMGRYLLQKPQGPAAGTQGLGYARPIAVNADPRESRMARIDGTELQKLFGPGTRVLAPDRLDELVPRGGEFWTALVILLLAAYAVEAVAGWIASVRSERRRSAEGAA